MNKNSGRTLAGVLLILVAFSVITFILPVEKNVVYWTAYGFAVLAILIQIVVLISAFGKGEDARSKFYGFPIAKIGITYLVIQIILSIVFMAISKIAPLWVVIITSLLIFIIAAVGFIVADATRDEIVRQDQKLKSDVSCITTLRSIVYPLPARCKDAEAVKALKNLADEFRYSDPVSSESLRTIETELEGLVNKLQRMVSDGKEELIPGACHEISGVLSERNRLCKLNKGK